MLTDFEIRNIEYGLFDIQHAGPDTTVPFVANKLMHASVVWINERWFLERQIDVTDADTRHRLDRWLVDEYAYLVPLEGEGAQAAAMPAKIFLADSYGNSEMATHGGSGRVGITGRFQVKGIGRTPLVGSSADWLHSHGCLWLEEALREAVYAEVTALEFPCGAVPVLAVLDTGMRHQLQDGKTSERRALSIRPVVVRPAYFERAVLFQPPGNEHEARMRDVRRVKQVVHYVESLARQGEPTLPERFAKTFRNLAQQIAFSRAQRLFPGNYASSNFSMDGALLDFGAFRALPNWCSYIAMNDVDGFGNENPLLSSSIKSMSFYVNKYKAAETEGLDPENLWAIYSEELERACQREYLYLFHLEDSGDEDLEKSALTTLYAYYRQQQRHEIRFQNGVKKKLDWLADVSSASETQSGLFSVERAVLADLARAIQSSRFDIKKKKELGLLSRATASRLLPVRLEIIRESLTIALNALIAQRDADGDYRAGAIEHAVHGIIARSRRHWPMVPRNMAVLAQFSSPRCAVLYCVDPATEERFIWVEAALLNDRVWLLDRWLERAVVEPCCYRYESRRWCGLFPASAAAPIATLPGMELRMPDSAIWFESGQGSA